MEHASKTVLVVEADPPVRELLSDVFQDEGYDVVTAYDGEAAHRMVAARRVDVVTIDMDVPAAAVGQLLGAASGSGAEPYIVALSSAQPPARDARRAHAVLAKPFDIDELLAAVRRLLASRRARSGVREARGRAYAAPEQTVPALVSAGN